MKKILLCIILLFCSCALFRKTGKTKNVATQYSKNQLDFEQLILKSSGKETQVFTYWNDSSFYQYQNIKEQINKAETGQLSTIIQHEAEETVAVKNTTSVQIWGVIGLIILTIVFGFLYYFVSKFS
jgi:ATP-dependent Zn protease